MNKPIHFSVIGLNHFHILNITETLLRAGAKLVSFYAIEPDLVADFSAKFPHAAHAHTKAEVLEDKTIDVVASAAIPSERAALGIEVMRHGKDFFVDKAGFTSLEQLAEVRRVQAETQRIYSVYYGERLENKSTTKAAELARAGAIGKVVQTIGLGPHKLNAHIRPAWFFKKRKTGGILCDLASHQMEQFLYFTQSTEAEIVSAHAGSVCNPSFPELQEFGEAIVSGNGGRGYLRVDWLSPASLPVYGDTRCTVLGTEGYIELRKNIDIEGRAGGDHLFLVDKTGTHYIPCADVELPFARQFLNDVEQRTETAMSQTHCFLASELALKAQALADSAHGAA